MGALHGLLGKDILVHTGSKCLKKVMGILEEEYNRLTLDCLQKEDFELSLGKH